MEAYDEEFYHAYITRTGVRVGGPARTVGVSRGTKTNSDGTWKQHKYVYKEGSRYIYPEDLQRKRNATYKNSLALENPAKTKIKVQNTRRDDETTLEKVDDYLYKHSIKYHYLSDAAKTLGNAVNKVYNRGKKFVENAKQNKNTPKKYNRSTSAASVLDNTSSKTSSSKPDPYVEDVFNALTYVLNDYEKHR